MSASRRRLVVLYVVVASLLITLGGRLWYIQVMNGTSYVKLASANQTRNIIVPAVRGQILDDVGNALVTKRTALVVSVNNLTLSQQPDGGAAVLHRLAPMLNMPYQLLQQKVRLCSPTVSQPCWAGSPYQPIPVDQNVSDQTALQIMEEQNQFPAVTAQPQGIAEYQQPDGADPAQILGYLLPATTQQLKADHLPSGVGYSSADLVGQSGLEEQYNNQLAGKTGTNTVSVNAAGDVTGTAGGTPAQSGDDLVTSINSAIQADAQQALSTAIGKARAAGNDANQGAAVVMTATGRVVAMASYPDYDPSVWVNGISQSQFNALFGAQDGAPAINWATQGQYAPGQRLLVLVIRGLFDYRRGLGNHSSFRSRTGRAPPNVLSHFESSLRFHGLVGPPGHLPDSPVGVLGLADTEGLHCLFHRVELNVRTVIW